MQRKLPPTVETLETLAMNAIANGGEFHGSTRNVHWDISGVCRSPVGVTLTSKHGRYATKKRSIMTVTMQTKCRKCPECRRERQLIWAGRAINEIAAAERTWFCTLTFRPEVQYLLESQAGAQANLVGLTPEERFPALARIAGKELTKFFKRLRERAPGKIRYLAVCEYHNSMKTSPEMRYRPHLHMLIHEREGQVQWKHLDASWALGHAKFKLVTGSKPAWYIAKYLTKDALTRVRASVEYGKTTVSDHSVNE